MAESYQHILECNDVEALDDEHIVVGLFNNLVSISS